MTSCSEASRTVPSAVLYIVIAVLHTSCLSVTLHQSRSHELDTLESTWFEFLGRGDTHYQRHNNACETRHPTDQANGAADPSTRQEWTTVTKNLALSCRVLSCPPTPKPSREKSSRPETGVFPTERVQFIPNCAQPSSFPLILPARKFTHQ